VEGNDTVVWVVFQENEQDDLEIIDITVVVILQCVCVC